MSTPGGPSATVGSGGPTAPAGPGGWVDVHNHLLPGVDDGPETVQESVETCRMLVDEGVTHAVATPHLFGSYRDPGRLNLFARRLNSLAAALQREELALTLYGGADVRIDVALTTALPSGGVPTVGAGGKHVLVEPPHDVWIEPAGVCKLLREAGLTAVLTHPERYPHVHQRGIDPALRWLEHGALLQVTAGSLLGDFGGMAEQRGWELLEHGSAAGKVLVASDAHDPRRRPPRLGASAAAIAGRLGRPAAVAVCRDLPWSVLAPARPVYSPAEHAAAGVTR